MPLTKLTQQLQAWWFAWKPVSPRGTGPARDERIGAGGLQGTLLCKQHKQMLAGVHQVVVPAANGAC